VSKVANSVIVVDWIEDDVKALITEKVFVSSHGIEQSFEQVVGNGYEEGEYDAGGSVFYVVPVYAAAFNHVEPKDIADWFEALPWQPRLDNASLTIHGNDYSVYVLVVDGECRRTVSEGG
jgi:hypothetical protein